MNTMPGTKNAAQSEPSQSVASTTYLRSAGPMHIGVLGLSEGYEAEVINAAHTDGKNLPGQGGVS